MAANGFKDDDLQLNGAALLSKIFNTEGAIRHINQQHSASCDKIHALKSSKKSRSRTSDVATSDKPSMTGTEMQQQQNKPTLLNTVFMADRCYARTKYKVFMKNQHNDFLNVLMESLREILQYEKEDDDDLKIDQEVDIECITIQQIAYEILHYIIIECHKAMEKRKNTFYKIINELLHNDTILRFIDISYLLRTNCHSFIKNKYFEDSVLKKMCSRHRDSKDGLFSDDEDLINMEHNNIDDIIDTIYNDAACKLIKNTNTAYSVSFALCKFRKSKDIHVFIAECCVLFWIMALTCYKNKKDQILTLDDDLFWIKRRPNNFRAIKYSINLKEANNSNAIYYCGIPGVILQHKEKKDDVLVLIEPHIFVHDDAAVIKALAS